MRITIFYCRAARGWFFFFFNDTATTEIYTLSLHDALPICVSRAVCFFFPWRVTSLTVLRLTARSASSIEARSEEHTSELQSQSNLVCRLLLEKKKHFQGEQEQS